MTAGPADLACPRGIGRATVGHLLSRRRAAALLYANAEKYARLAASTRLARSASGSFRSGSTWFTNRASKAACPGAVRAVRSSVCAHEA